MAGPSTSTASVDPQSRVWITLITRSSYLPGVVLLVHTLYKCHSVHSLIILYTASLSSDCAECLSRLRTIYPKVRALLVQPITLPPGLQPIATRFDDTLTKLRAFEPINDAATLEDLGLPQQPQQVCFLDADTMIFRNLDDIFDISRPSSDWIAAHHQCVCNIDNDPWAPPEWNMKNCPATLLKHPSALEAPIPSSSLDGAGPTFQLLNSGVFVCSPSQGLWQQMEVFRLGNPKVKDFVFPDQNFLDEFFHDRWVPIGWQYNAYKTHRYWHPAMWRDDEVRLLHYIVDKPWQERISPDGTAGYLGRDGITHGWWWNEYEAWVEDMQGRGKEDVVAIVNAYVAPPLD